MNLFVKLDTSQLEEWSRRLTQSGLKRAMSGAVNAAAREARSQAIEAMVQDMNVPRGIAIKSITPIRRATERNPTASFTATKARISILSTRGSKLVMLRGATTKRSGKYVTRIKGRKSQGDLGLTAATHVFGGGNSAKLSVGSAFLMVNPRGGQAVVYRTKRGHRSGKLKAVYAEHPGTALGKANSPGQRTWNEVANSRVVKELETNVQAALDGKM